MEACPVRARKVLSGVNPHQIAAAAHKVELLKEQVRYWQREHERCNALASRNFAGPVGVRQEPHRVEPEADRVAAGGSRPAAPPSIYVRDEDRKLAEAKVIVAESEARPGEAAATRTRSCAPRSTAPCWRLLKREGEGSRLFDPEPVVIFGDTSRLRVRAEVDERFVAGLGVGQKALVFGRGLGDRQYPGRVVLIKSIMGKKTVFSRSATERKDLDVVQVMIEMEPGFRAPIGLEVDVLLGGSCDMRPDR